MTETPESLRELGENITNVANAWAGAEDYLSRGLVEWTRRLVGDNQEHAVRAAVAACELALPLGRSNDTRERAHTSAEYNEQMLALLKRWLVDKSRESSDALRKGFDFSRAQHAWHGFEHLPHFWVHEAIDHACLAVWSGQRASYIVPLDFATSAARSVACVYHALIAGPQKASEDQIARAVAAVTSAVKNG